MDRLMCDECGGVASGPVGDQTEVCYCRPRNAVIDEIVVREKIRTRLADLMNFNPYGPLGHRITERLLRSAGY